MNSNRGIKYNSELFDAVYNLAIKQGKVTGQYLNKTEKTDRMAANKNIVVNVGLNNSPADHYETLRLLDKYIYSGSYWISSQRMGTYRDQPEPTTVTQGETKVKPVANT